MNERSLLNMLRRGWAGFHQPRWALGLPIPRRATLLQQVRALKELGRNPATRDQLAEIFRPRQQYETVGTTSRFDYHGSNLELSGGHTFLCVDFPGLRGPLRRQLAITLPENSTVRMGTSLPTLIEKGLSGQYRNRVQRHLRRLSERSGLNLLALS